MNSLPADSPVLPPPPTESWLPGPKPPDEGWTRKKFFVVLAFVLVAHVVLIFLIGAKKPIIPRPVTSVPHLQLADSASDFIALGDPTLFARPNIHDWFTAAWRRMAPIAQPHFDWTEQPRYLTPAPGDLGTVFRQFVQNDRTTELPLNFKPEPRVSLPERALDDAGPEATTMQISGELSQRPLLRSMDLPAVAVNDVIAPSKVQALVDTAGNVASAVVLEPNAYGPADQLALQLVRNLRFAPAPRLMFGDITFTWHTAPTNAVPATLP